MSTTYTYSDLKNECRKRNNFVEHPTENYVGKFSEMSFIVGGRELGRLKHFGRDDLIFVEHDGTSHRVMKMSSNVIYLFDYQKTNINMIEVSNAFEVVQERIVC
jgi:hypothetical protein